MKANTEYLWMPEDRLVAIKPANLTYQEAAAVLYEALTAMSKRIQTGSAIIPVA